MITNALISDAKKLFILENTLFGKDDFPLSLSSFYYHIKQNKIFIYKVNDKIVGYALWLKRKNYFRLYSICIDNNFQGKGYAQKLLEYSLDVIDSPQYTLEVKVTNTKAIKLYEKYDFKIQKTLVGFYPNNIDGYKMIKNSGAQ